MNPNIIRSIIFLIAALILIIYPKKVMKFQEYILKKINIKARDSEKSTRILGIIFLIIAAILFYFGLK
ncbi:MAG: hypothetical protein KKF56_02250 [Nanoarchaeota archaeon]|nr:hypothetical protein [Nanoarchaeota archaeon]